jgi:hypothetical protein
MISEETGFVLRGEITYTRAHDVESGPALVKQDIAKAESGSAIAERIGAPE